MLGLVPTTSGSITYRRRNGRRRSSRSCVAAELRELRTSMQMVFQDPHAALNPAMTIEQAVGTRCVIHGKLKGDGAAQAGRARRWRRSGCPRWSGSCSKYPADLSGGQKQRAVIARAIILGPRCWSPTSRCRCST